MLATAMVGGRADDVNCIGLIAKLFRTGWMSCLTSVVIPLDLKHHFILRLAQMREFTLRTQAQAQVAG